MCRVRRKGEKALDIFNKLLYELKTLCRYSSLYVVKMGENGIEIDTEHPLNLTKPIETIKQAEESLDENGMFKTHHEEEAHNQIDAFIQTNPFLEGQILSRKYSIDQRIFSVFGVITSVRAPPPGYNPTLDVDQESAATFSGE